MGTFPLHRPGYATSLRSSRRALCLSIVLWIFGLMGTLTIHAQDEAGPAPVLVAEVRGVVNPVLSAYIVRLIDEAETRGGRLLVLELDTPGGLDTSMREITQKILASKVPVAVYVYPQGARAASAGVFITYAAHIAAMAPQTNIGSAHPVSIGNGGEEENISQEMKDKVTNDAVASITATAELRGRNAEWAEEAIRSSKNLPASEALRLNVVDVVADNLTSLLDQIDGRTVHVSTGDVVLATRGAPVENRSMTAVEDFFHVISDPTVAYLLLSLGGLALIYELGNPGAILPGVVGGIAVLIALYSLGTLPINMAGLGLILFSLLLLLVDLAIAGSGFLTVGGILSFVLGSLLLATSPDSQAYIRVSAPAVIAMSATIAVFFTFVVAAILQVRLKPSVVGAETLTGAEGVARSEVGETGTVVVEGELWQATAVDPTVPIPPGSHVRVVSIKGLRLTVRPE